MWEDPIVEEVRKAGAEIAKECDYDMHKYFERIKKGTEKLRKNGFKIVTKEDLLEMAAKK